MVNDHVFGETGDICLLDLRIVKIVEVIQDGHFAPGREQFFDQVRADETRAASDKNSHAPRSSTTKHMECTKKIIFGTNGAVGTACFGVRSVQRAGPTTSKNRASAIAGKPSLARAPR